MEVLYPRVSLDPERDAFVVWVRWVSRESPASPHDPPNQGIRVELQLNRNSVLGPSIVYRRDLEQPVYLKANQTRVAETLRAAADTARVDVQLVIHGSVANAPYAALYIVRDYDGEPISTQKVKATPFLQVQPSTPGDQWQVAGQSNARLHYNLEGQLRHLKVIH